MRLFAWRSGWSIVERLLSRIDAHKLLTLAAALSFYTALSLSPLLIILFWVVGSLGFHDQSVLTSEVVMLVGPEAGRVLDMVIENTREKLALNSFAGLIGFITLLISAASVFGQLQMSLNTIFEVPPPKSVNWLTWLQKRVLSIGMVFAMGFLAVVSLLVNAVVSFVTQHWDSDGSLVYFEAVLSFGFFVGFFSLLYKTLPNRPLAWKDTLIGGTMTATLFVIGKSAIGLYLGQTSVGSAYGVAGSLIILLVWVYYSSALVLFGAELTSELESRSRAPHPSENVLEQNGAALASSGK